MSHSEAKPLVVVTVSWRVAPALRMRSVTSCRRSSSSVAARCRMRPCSVSTKRTVPALEQGDAQVLLQRADLPADGGLRDEQLLGRLGEGEVACRRLEALDQVQGGRLKRRFCITPAHA
jgi:hypothetical protein